MLGKGDPSAVETIRKGLEGIATLYPNHIWKEDFLLFPITVKAVSVKKLSNREENSTNTVMI